MAPTLFDVLQILKQRIFWKDVRFLEKNAIDAILVRIPKKQRVTIFNLKVHTLGSVTFKLFLS